MLEGRREVALRLRLRLGYRRVSANLWGLFSRACGALARYDGAMRRMLREPTLHFALLALLLFGLYEVVVPDDRLIVVSDDVAQSVAAQFAEKEGRPPTPEELEALIDTWVGDEVLVREALDAGIDEADPVIRERLVQKMIFVLEDRVAGRPEGVAAARAELRQRYAVRREDR